MRGTPVRFVDFTGGVNTKAAPYLVSPKEARDARNVVSTVRGSIRKRNGCQTLASPAAELLTMRAADALSPTLMVGVTSANDVVKIDVSGVVTSIKGANVVTVPRWSIAQGPAQTLGPVFMSNGTDVPLAWTGTGNATPWTLTSGTIPRPTQIVAHNNRMWLGNLAGNTGLYGVLADAGSSLCFSDIGNPRSFPLANIVQLDPNDGDSIIAFGKVGPYLLVFKRRKTFLIFDGDTGANRRISDTIGCCAPRSVVETPAGTFFLSQDRGIYATTGSKFTQMSDNISPTLSAVASSARDTAAGAYFNDHYYLSLATTGPNNDLTLDFDTTTNSWWLHTFAGNDWSLWRPGTTTFLYAANVGAAKVSRAFVDGEPQDNGVNFTCSWKGPWQAFGAPYLRKRIRQIHFDGTGPFDVYVGRDFQASEDVAGTALLSPGTSTTFGGTGAFGGDNVYGDIAGTQEGRVFTLGVARAWSVRFIATSALTFEIDSYTMAYTPRKN